MANLTSVSKWAASLGISRQQGYAAVKRCGITVTNSMLDSEYASILYRRHTRPRANGKRKEALPAQANLPPASDDNDTTPKYDGSRAKREAAEASIAEMKEAEMRGTLIRADSMRNAWANKISAARDALLQIPHRLAPVLVVETDLERVVELLEAELRQAMLQLSEGHL